eukprot:2104532-Rhodomonas_salina.1
MCLPDFAARRGRLVGCTSRAVAGWFRLGPWLLKRKIGQNVFHRMLDIKQRATTSTLNLSSSRLLLPVFLDWRHNAGEVCSGRASAHGQ